MCRFLCDCGGGVNFDSDFAQGFQDQWVLQKIAFWIFKGYSSNLVLHVQVKEKKEKQIIEKR